MKIKESKVFGIRLSALIEVVAFLLVINICSYYFGLGNRYIDIYPHPYWIILLVVVIQYDLKETIICVILMILFLYVGNMPIKKLTDTSFYYYMQLSIRPVLWLATAVVMDALRKKRMKITTELVELIKDSDEKLEVVSRSYNLLQKKNKNLELRLAGELNSAVKIYNAARKLENLNASNYMDIMEKVVLSVMNPVQFSIYTLDNNGLSRKYAYNRDKDSHYRNHFSNDSKLYRSIVVLKKKLSIVRSEDELILKGQGMLAGPLIDIGSGEVMGMIKFEKIDFEELDSKNIELFSILCEWLGSAYRNVIRMDSAESNSVINFDTMLYSVDFFSRQVFFLTKLAKRSKIDFTSITINIANREEISSDIKKETVALLYTTMKENLRFTDQVFDLDYRNGAYSLLMPCTDENGAEVVLNKIKNNLLNKNVSTRLVKYSFRIKVLNKK